MARKVSKIFSRPFKAINKPLDLMITSAESAAPKFTERIIWL